jgi:multidrug efflux system membrane fusion protein
VRAGRTFVFPYGFGPGTFGLDQLGRDLSRIMSLGWFIMNRMKQTLLKTQVGRLCAAGLAVMGLVLLAGLPGCTDKPAAAQGAPPPAAVSVANPVQKDVVEWDVYTGYLEAPQAANVAARVSGLVMEMPFVEGSIVKRGDVLAVIDDRPFKADLDSKIADENKAASALQIAKVIYNRLVVVQKADAASQQDVDIAKANVEQAEAALSATKAAVEISRLNLEWCRVLSPIDGRVSYKLVTVGNLVNGGVGQATLLTTVQSVDPMYCYVDVDEHSVLKYQKLTAEGKLANARDGKVPCYVQLSNETDFPHEGVIDFVDNHVDSSTGTQRVRGIFDNKSGLLTPGFFARLTIPGSGHYKALLIPDEAIGTDQSTHTVLVVDKDDKVEVRPIESGALFGTMRSIVSGLSTSDRVIVNGQMHARPGSVVTPTMTELKLDAVAFTDPGSAAMSTVPATNTAPTDAPLDAAATRGATTQSTNGTR